LGQEGKEHLRRIRLGLVADLDLGLGMMEVGVWWREIMGREKRRSRGQLNYEMRGREDRQACPLLLLFFEFETEDRGNYLIERFGSGTQNNAWFTRADRLKEHKKEIVRLRDF
jgi:hypothetical protein